MADTSKQSTYRKKKTEGLGDSFSTNFLYNTSALIKSAGDKIRGATTKKKSK